MVRRRLAPSRAAAQHLIAGGRVRVGGAVADKPARLVAPGEAVAVADEGPRYVSRGGLKLEAALAGFGIDPAGRRVIDVGASTGGFTDCLLQHGASAAVAIDVGRNQLHEKLRADPRVVSRERTDVRAVEAAAVGGPADLVVADLSFISLGKVSADLCKLAAGDLVALVKPQFEAGRAEADRGRGVIKDPAVRRRAVLDVCDGLEAAGAAIMGIMASPVTGADGNVEFWVHADVRPGAAGLGPQARARLAAELTNTAPAARAV